MDQSRIAVRYAKALFETALEKKVVEELKKDIDFVAQVCADETMLQLIESPVCKPSEKVKAFDAIFGKKVNALTLNFLQMVIGNKRERFIPAMCRNFASRYYNYANIKQAHIVTAQALDSKMVEKIKKAIAGICKADVEISTSEDASLIGGFVLRIDDQQLDASVSTKLRTIKQEFTDTTIN